MRKPHANSAHRRVSTSQPSPTRPVISAAIANANGTVNPTYPRYRIGGWNSTSTWFCSKGLGPWPSKPGPTAGPAANGFAGPKATSAKKAHTANITTSAQPTSASSSRLRNRHATAAVKPASTTTHSRIEPSRALHIAATL